MKKLVFVFLMSLEMSVNAKDPYVSIHPNMNDNKIGDMSRIKYSYDMTLNYDKSKNSWISLKSNYNVKKITMVLEDESVIELNRTGKTVKETYWIAAYGASVPENLKSCTVRYDFSISNKNRELLTTHDIKKIYFDDNEYETEFCLFASYYILDSKYDSKKNGSRDEYSYIK